MGVYGNPDVTCALVAIERSVPTRVDTDAVT
jgi:hypothetical protein